MTRYLLFAIALLLWAAPVFAGDECHIPSSVPIVTNWTITASPGSVVMSARLKARDSCCRPSERYDIGVPDGRWWVWLIMRPSGSTQGHAVNLDGMATVTDSTLHIEVPHDPGAFDYFAYIGGTDYNAQECTYPYDMQGTLVILPPATPARRVSLGSLKVLYR